MKNLAAKKFWATLAVIVSVPMTLTASFPVDAFAATYGWQTENGVKYWYENGVKQGTEGRGKEIYDPDSDAWYWLDAVDGGKMAVSKDVYQESFAGAYADRPDGTGKWVRYDENGHMVKGWQTTAAGTYYFDLQTGAMAKGNAAIDGKNYTFDVVSGILQSSAGVENGWYSENGKDYWYENGVRQGYDPNNPSYRGKEIYDPGTGAWYWLDNVEQGAKAVSKDVYQESSGGKWVRYDANGHMIKGWNRQGDDLYYFDLITGAMTKGYAVIDGDGYFFDETTGILTAIEGFDYGDLSVAFKNTFLECSSYSGDKHSTSQIEDWDGTVTYNKTRNTYDVKLNFSIKVKYADFESAAIKYELFNESGVIVKNGVITVSNPTAGQTYTSSITLSGLTPGEFTLVFSDYYY